MQTLICITFQKRFEISKGARKTREWTTWHEVTRVENAGVENAARDDMEMRPFNATVEFS